MNLRNELFKNQDIAYRDFHSRLVPTVDKDKIIGVRVPVLRKIAKQALLHNAQNSCEYYEEIMVRGIAMGLKRCSLDEHICDIKSFVPLIDNWATCDICVSSMKFVLQYKDELFDLIVSYIGDDEYCTRFSIVMLMTYYFDDEYIDRVLDILASIKSDYYYVNMAIAWALSVAFVKYKDKVFEIIKSMTLSKDVQNKTIQKIKDSYRVNTDIKLRLNEYKKGLGYDKNYFMGY